MKGKKMFVGGMLVGAALMVSVSAAADSLSLIGKKVTSETEVYLDGQLFDTAPVINGTSLAPLRKAYEAAGYTVEYRDKKVYLQSRTKEEEPVSDGTATPEVDPDEAYRRLQGSVDRKAMEIQHQKNIADPRSGFTKEEQEAASKEIKKLETELKQLEEQLESLRKTD